MLLMMMMMMVEELCYEGVASFVWSAIFELIFANLCQLRMLQHNI